MGSYDGLLYALSADRGKLLWSYQTENFINGAPAITGNLAVFGGCDARLHLVSALDGRPQAAHGRVHPVQTAIPGAHGQRAAAGHAVAAGVVDDHEVGAAGLGHLGRDAGAGAAADDRPAGLDLRPEAPGDLGAGDERHRVLLRW